jgi:hypothetical protein
MPMNGHSDCLAGSRAYYDRLGAGSVQLLPAGFSTWR